MSRTKGLVIIYHMMEGEAESNVMGGALKIF